MWGKSPPRSAIEAAERVVESITKEGQSIVKGEDWTFTDSDICSILKKKSKSFWW